MRGVNKVMLIGRLGKDPELKYTTSGNPVVNFSIATTDVRGSKEDKQEYTEWHKVVAWGRLAEICGEYLSSGKMVYVEGSLRTNKWQDKQGHDRWTTEIAATQMQILSPAGEKQSLEPASDEPSFDIDDDVPF